MNERFVDFMYVLMRDHLICGAVEEIYENHVQAGPGGNKASIFTNKGLEQYAREIVGRIEKVSEK